MAKKKFMLPPKRISASLQQEVKNPRNDVWLACSAEARDEVQHRHEVQRFKPIGATFSAKLDF